mmetsp:Transcript_93224/g.268421  ORF Transcript_93224/g.268421 Transcript_93224/m.268421 type:complete len:402 (+) Transcript_93224:47-1252(+)
MRMKRISAGANSHDLSSWRLLAFEVHRGIDGVDRAVRPTSKGGEWPITAIPGRTIGQLELHIVPLSPQRLGGNDGVAAAASQQVLPSHGVRGIARKGDAVRNWAMWVDGETPVQAEVAKHLRQVVDGAAAVKGIRNDVVIVAFNGCDIRRGQWDMSDDHRQKQGDKEEREQLKNHKYHHVGYFNDRLPEHGVLQVEQNSRAIHQLRHRHDQPYEGRQAAIHDQEQEKLVVFEAHTVLDPGTMVVHSQDADAADVAMVRALRAGGTTLPAERRLAGLPLESRRHHEQPIRDLADELMPLLRHHAGIRSMSDEVAPHGEPPNRVEDDHVRQDQEVLPHKRQDAAEVHDIERNGLVDKDHQARQHRGLRSGPAARASMRRTVWRRCCSHGAGTGKQWARGAPRA